MVGTAALALLNAPLVAALVITFRPSGFAVFKAAAKPAAALPAEPETGNNPKPVEASGRIRGDRFALISAGILLVSMIPVALLLPRKWLTKAVFIWLFLLAYVPLTPSALRVKLRSTVLRYLFGLTAVPVCALIFIWMMHRLFTEFPTLSETYSAAVDRGARNPGLLHAVIVLIPTGILFAGWYWAIRLLDQGLERVGVGARTTILTAVVITFLGGAAYTAHDAGIIGSTEWRMARRTYGGAAPDRDWLREAQLRQETARWGKTWFYPRRIEGQCHESAEWYRVDWKVLDADQRYYYYWGLEQSVFESYDRNLRARGYVQESLTRFRDCAGNEKFQATWTTRVKQ